MLYELAAGQHPFGKVDSMAIIARILEGETPDLLQLNPKIPRELDRIIRRCLKKNPNDRYNSTRDLLADLEQVADTAKEGTPWKVSSAAPGSKTGALWWWQFHQAVAGFGYYAMLYPLWRVKQWLGGIEGSFYFFPALIAVGVAANLRLHLWFISGFYISEIEDQRRKVTRWIHWADWLFAFMLAISAVRIHTEHAIIATLLMAVAIGSFVASTLIEPTSARAALDKKE
jgi:hypothetical protein